jgi:hypothetical protein
MMDAAGMNPAAISPGEEESATAYEPEQEAGA